MDKVFLNLCSGTSLNTTPESWIAQGLKILHCRISPTIQLTGKVKFQPSRLSSLVLFLLESNIWKYLKSLHKSTENPNIIFSRMNIIFLVMPEMSSLGVLFRKISSLLFWQKSNFIIVEKRNTTFTNISYKKTSCFHVFFEKYYLSFSVRKKISYFQEKETPFFLMI